MHRSTQSGNGAERIMVGNVLSVGWQYAFYQELVMLEQDGENILRRTQAAAAMRCWEAA